MPILTEEELQDIVNKETEANVKLEEKNQQLLQSHNEKKELESQKKRLQVSTVLLFVLFVALLLLVLFQPKILPIDMGTSLENDEVVVNKSTLEDYENKIEELEERATKYTNPLELQGFYAVQLGAFKEFEIPLSSDSYSVVHNAEFNDFNLYTLGIFKTEEEAERLKTVVRQLNFRDAFVGYYEDGKRLKSNY